MKLDKNLKCPHCGSKNAHAFMKENVEIWDDSHHEFMNEEFSELDILNCDRITYECKCRDCEKHFYASFKLDITVCDSIMVKKENREFNYFKK